MLYDEWVIQQGDVISPAGRRSRENFSPFFTHEIAAGQIGAGRRMTNTGSDPGHISVAPFSSISKI
jgi:hypothetical protein